MIIKQADVHMGTPRPRWGTDNPMWCLERSDRKHTPFNKRPGSVHHSRCDLTVGRFIGTTEEVAKTSVSFELQEVTQAKHDGPTQVRTISMSMPYADAVAFAKFILEGK